MIEINKEIQDQLFALAYKMTGQIAASKDISQEAISKCLLLDASKITHKRAYLFKVATNTAISYLQKNQKEQQAYPGIWLPEPIIHFEPQVEASIDLDYGLTVLLSKLTPTERAVFILKQSFDYKYDEIAETLDLATANCRKIYQRLKTKISLSSSTKEVHAIEKKRIVDAFVLASQTGNMENLIDRLKEDIEIYSDGGGKVSAAQNVLKGMDVCLKFMLGIYSKGGANMSFESAQVNGEPGFLIFEKEKLATVVSFTLEKGQISHFYFIRNPDKMLLPI